jgi:hypothetical protein
MPPNSVPVTVDNFTRAESDMYFGNVIGEGGFATFSHHRTAMPIEKQTVIRANRDTLYSAAVFDLDAGPVTVTMPDAGGRFMSMMVIDEDHYTVAVLYGAGSWTYTREQVGTRYVMIAIRTLVDPANPKDVETVHALQDAIKVSQRSPGKFEIPKWDAESQKKVRNALIVLGSTLSNFTGAFGTRNDVDPIMHLIGTAIGWGGNPQKDAIYLNFSPEKNDGKTIYRMKVKDVPVDGFWSVSVYNADGYFEPNPLNAYSSNNLTAQKSADGSIEIQFGGCDAKVPNCLPTVPGWNATIRLYRPRPEVVSGTWKFPLPAPVT